MSKKKNSSRTIKGKCENPDYIVYTDGGCSFNPGGIGGIGVVIIDCEIGETTEISRGFAATTNNRMEVLAVIEGLKELPENCTVNLFSDSQYVLNCMSGVWQKKKNSDLWAELQNAQKGKEIELIWVRGHNGDPLNERCDALATTAMSLSNLEIDEGYEAEKEAGREFFRSVDQHLSQNSGGAMAVQIAIPDAIKDTEPRYVNWKDYKENFRVNDACAKAIVTFYMSHNRNFKSFLALKTGGIDGYSRKSAEKIAETKSNSGLYLETVRKYLNDEKDIASACKWNARGLTLEDSIRKALVDAEVRANCIRY